jgi:hypothetical protein
VVLVTFPTEQEHHDAVVLALTDAAAAPYDYHEKVPRDVTGYTLVGVTDRFGGNLRLTGQVGVRAVRVTCRYVGLTPDNVREIRSRGESALREQSIAVGAHESTPIQFETAEPIDEDGSVASGQKWYSALSAYTYTV